MRWQDPSDTSSSVVTTTSFMSENRIQKQLQDTMESSSISQSSGKLPKNNIQKIILVSWC